MPQQPQAQQGAPPLPVKRKQNFPYGLTADNTPPTDWAGKGKKTGGCQLTLTAAFAIY